MVSRSTGICDKEPATERASVRAANRAGGEAAEWRDGGAGEDEVF